MSDEKTEEKKLEEKSHVEPWLFEQFNKIISISTTPEKSRPVFDEFFKSLTYEKYRLKDPTAVEWIKKVGARKNEIWRDELAKIATLFLTQMEPALPLSLFNSWITLRARKFKQDLETVDYFTFYCLHSLNKEVTCKLFEATGNGIIPLSVEI